MAFRSRRSFSHRASAPPHFLSSLPLPYRSALVLHQHTFAANEPSLPTFLPVHSTVRHPAQIRVTGGSPQLSCYNWAEAEVVSGGLGGAEGYVNLVGSGYKSNRGSC